MRAVQLCEETDSPGGFLRQGTAKCCLPVLPARGVAYSGSLRGFVRSSAPPKAHRKAQRQGTIASFWYACGFRTFLNHARMTLESGPCSVPT